MKINYKKRSVTQSEYVVKYEQKYKKKLNQFSKAVHLIPSIFM